MTSITFDKPSPPVYFMCMNARICLSLTLLFSGCANRTQIKTTSTPLPNIIIDHVFIQLDPQTYTALAKEKSVCNEIFFCELGKKVSTWEGHYFQGTESYLEFFNKGIMKNNKQTHEQSALGLYTETSNSLDDIHKHLIENTYLNNEFKLYERKFARNSYASKNLFAIWVLEPKISFLESSDISRKNWSNKMRTKGNAKTIPTVGSFSKLKYILNVAEFDLAVNTLRSLNFVDTNNKDESHSFSNGETQVELLKSDTSIGLVYAEQRIDRSIQSKVKKKKIGSIMLTIDSKNQKVAWDFYPKAK